MSLIYSTELNAPTPEQLAARVVPLEGLYWPGDNPDYKRATPYAPTVPELLKFMEQYGIPQTAKIEYYECGSHTMSLEWGAE